MKCPICESKSLHRLFKLCDNMKIMGSDFPDKPAYVAKCDNCGLVFTDTEATQQEFLSYYINGAVAPKYYDMFGAEATDEYYEHLLKLMAPYVDKDSAILDIAGAWGELGEYLKLKGYTNITVLDPNERCISSAREKGLKTVLADSTDMFEIADKSIDMVILNHALEHILDVKSTMNEIIRILKDEGNVFIELPDAGGYEDEEAAPFNFLTYEHVLHMTMNDLENLAGILCLTILDKGYYYKKVSNYPSIYAVLRKGAKRDIHYSDRTAAKVEKYIAKSKECLERFLRPLRESQEPLVLWGIGASTAILIEAFDGCNVKQLIDRNPNRQGITFSVNGKQIRIDSPDTVSFGTIVILSIPYHESIERQIKEMGLKNKVVSLI